MRIRNGESGVKNNIGAVFMQQELYMNTQGHFCLHAIPGADRWSEKFSARFSRFDTIPAVTDSHPDT